MTVLLNFAAIVREFFEGISAFLGSRGGQMAIAFVIYLTSIAMIEKGPRDIGEKIAFMAIGSVLQSMVSRGNDGKKE